MTDNPLAHYAIDQPLTEEELLFIKALRNNEEGEDYLEALCAEGVLLEISNSNGKSFASYTGSSAAFERLLEQFLLKTTVNFSYQSRFELALGAAGFALRLGLDVLSIEHPEILKCCDNQVACLEYLGRMEEALSILRYTLPIRERIQGTGHADTLENRGNLIACLEFSGRFNEALPYLKCNLIESERSIGRDHPKTIIRRNRLATCLSAMDRWGEALSHWKRTYDDSKRVLGPDHSDTLKNCGNLAKCLSSLDREDEALHYWKITALDSERIHGPDHTDTLTYCSHLAKCLSSLGQDSVALPLYEAVLASSERILGPDHSVTLIRRNNLAESYYSLNRFSDALPHLERTVAEKEKIKGLDNPDALSSRDKLAKCIMLLGRAIEALPLFESILSAREQTLGTDHPDTLTSRNNLAGCLVSLGRFSEALPHFKRALNGREQDLGTDHPETQVSRHHLANCFMALDCEREALPLYEIILADQKQSTGSTKLYSLDIREKIAECLSSLGRADEALPHFECTLADRGRVLGLDHPDTLKSYNNLAWCYYLLGRVAKALSLFRKALDDRERVLGPEHHDTLKCRMNLASCLNEIGRSIEALPLFERNLSDCIRFIGQDNLLTLASRNNLAACLEDLGRTNEALPYFERNLSERERIQGPDHPNTLTSQNNLAECLHSLGCWARASQLFDITLSDRERVLGPDHRDTLTSKHNLAWCYSSQRRWDDAVPLYKGTLFDRERTLGSDHPDTLTSRHNLAWCYSSQRRWDDAVPLYERTLIDRERVLGSEHPDTLMSRNDFAWCLNSLGHLDEALCHWCKQIDALQAYPQPGGKWLDLLGSCACGLDQCARQGSCSNWSMHFSSLSSSLLGVVDLESPEQMAVARAGVAKFYTTYLGLCVDLDRHDVIPKVLAARQGRKLAALVLDELEAAGQSMDPDSPRDRFQQLRLELRQLALGLQVIEGDGGMSGEGRQHVTDVDAFYARKHEQMQAYKDKLEVYRELKAELETTDPDFTISAAALDPRLPDLQAQLKENEGLVLLFEREGSESEPVTRMALLVTRGSSVLVPLFNTQLSQGAELANAWHGSLFTRAGMRRAGCRDAEIGAASLSEEAGLFNDFTVALQAGLWNPLAEHLGGLTRLHLVTHGNWHLLPVELGAPKELELACYPGFVYYHRLRHQDMLLSVSTEPQSNQHATGLAPDNTMPLGLAVNDAEDIPYLEPIPFVRAEASLIEALWRGTVHANPNLNVEQPVLGVLHLAAHGQVDEKDPARANVILSDQVLDFHKSLGARQHPPVVVLSACTVGRTMDDPDGEPLGLAGSFLLKGTRYVVASLQPVPDFYMPLLIALFYQAWNSSGSPNAALIEAKCRLRSGEWYPETEALVRIHYRPVIEQALADATSQPRQTSWQDPLLRLTHAWPFPLAYRALHPDDDQDTLEDLYEVIGTQDGRSEITGRVLNTLVAERASLPRDVADTLCTWVRGFGNCSEPGTLHESLNRISE